MGDEMGVSLLNDVVLASSRAKSKAAPLIPSIGESREGKTESVVDVRRFEAMRRPVITEEIHSLKGWVVAVMTSTSK